MHTSKMNIAVIGGGMSGVMSAWALALKGCHVDLFERGELLGATNPDSTKMLRRALLFLESGRLKLVSQVVHDRHWWMVKAPHLAKAVEITLPLYSIGARSKWMVKL